MASKTSRECELIQRGTRLLKPVPIEQLVTRASVLAILARLEVELPNYRPVTIIKRAFNEDCLTLSDMQILLGHPIQFISIADDYWIPSQPQDPLIPHETIDPLLDGRFMDVLLFIAELLNPSVDRLRIARKRYNVLIDSLGFDPRRDQYPFTYTSSPAQVCSRMVEKQFYNNSTALADSKYCSSQVPCPYWLFSCPVNPKSADEFWLLAFDENYNYVPLKQMIITIKGSDNADSWLEESHLHHSQYLTSGRVSDPINRKKRCLKRFCTVNGLSMVGTPFFTPSSSVLHVLGKQLVVSTKSDYVAAYIPRFFVGNHLATLISEEFSDLDMMMGRKKRKLEDVDVHDAKISNSIRFAAVENQMMIRIDKPRPNDNTLSEDEIQYAVDCAWKALMKCGYSHYSACDYITQIVSPWWQREETLEKKLKRYLNCHKLNQIHVEKSVDQVLKEVTETISANTESSDHKYPWARFCRERARAALNRRKFAKKSSLAKRNKKNK